MTKRKANKYLVKQIDKQARKLKKRLGTGKNKQTALYVTSDMGIK